MITASRSVLCRTLFIGYGAPAIALCGWHYECYV